MDSLVFENLKLKERIRELSGKVESRKLDELERERDQHLAHAVMLENENRQLKEQVNDLNEAIQRATEKIDKMETTDEEAHMNAKELADVVMLLQKMLHIHGVATTSMDNQYQLIQCTKFLVNKVQGVLASTQKSNKELQVAVEMLWSKSTEQKIAHVKQENVEDQQQVSYSSFSIPSEQLILTL